MTPNQILRNRIWGALLALFLLSCETPLDMPLESEILDSKVYSFDERGDPEFRICSQNLHNFGDKKRRKYQKAQQNDLVKRFVEGRCDIIAVQELIGASVADAKKTLNILERALEKKTDRKFSSFVAKSHDKRIRNGFLVNDIAGKVVRFKSYYRAHVPAMDVLGPYRFFARGPAALWVEVPTKGGNGVRTVVIVTYHFKSQWGYWKDTTRTRYETLRMEMAEGLRRIVDVIKKEAPANSVVIVLGDRNSVSESPSAAILSGVNRLDDYIADSNNLCSVKGNGNSVCEADRRYSPYLVDLLGSRFRKFGKQYSVGTFHYKGHSRLYDEMYIHPDNMWMVIQDAKGLPSIGVLRNSKKGSDHFLIWVELNW